MEQNINNITIKQQVKNASIYMIPVITSNILPLISLPIILSYLSPEEYGSYALSLAFATIVVGFCEVSLFNVFERNYFAYKNNRAELLYTIVSFVFFISSITGILIYNNKRILANWFIQNQELHLLLFITYCGWAIFSINNYFLSFIKNSGNAKLNVGFTLGFNIIGFLLNIFFVAYLQIGPLGLAFGLLISNSIIFIIASIYFLSNMQYSFNSSILISSLKLSLPLFPTGILASLGKQFDKYIISVIAGAGGTGIYAIGQRISNLVGQFMNAIHKVYGPIVYHKMFSESAKGSKEIGNYLTPFAYFSVGAALFFSLFSEEALIILAPPEYLKSIGVINLLSIRYALTFFAKQPQLMYAGKTIVQSILTFINFFFTIIILYLFVNHFGLIGAAAGILLTSIIYISLLIWKGQQYYKIHYEWLKLSAIYGLLIFGSISTLIFYEIGITYNIRIFIKILSCFTFIGLGMYLRIVTKNNLLILIKSYGKK